MANPMKSLFEITPERAAAALKRLGFLTADERAKQEREQRANGPPLPYVETPDHLKRERAEALERGLARAAAQRDFYADTPARKRGIA